jgi:DMSO/TMAO reductase YedYZ molybdopterin-dependent catalytic subunit
VLIPVVLAKLWSVVPKLFAWPPVRSLAQLLERVSLLALVGGVLFEMVTGVMNIQYDYGFGFSFYTGHYWGAWVFIAGFVVHVLLKFPTMLASLRSGGVGRWLHDSAAQTRPETDDHGTGLVAVAPSPPSMSRRTMVAVVAGGSGLLALHAVGDTVDALRPLAFLSPRGQSYGDGPTDFQVNRTDFGAGIRPDIGDSWTLRLSGGTAPVVLTRADLEAMGLATETLPIACVEGWSTTRTWTGVRLRDLARLAGQPRPGSVLVESLERGGFGSARLAGNQVADGDALLALRVNGVDLSLDHGYPARVIVPGAPGVHCTKWVTRLTVEA